MEENELVQVTSATASLQCDQLHADFEAKAREVLSSLDACGYHEDVARIAAALTSADKAGYARGLQDASDGDAKCACACHLLETQRVCDICQGVGAPTFAREAPEAQEATDAPETPPSPVLGDTANTGNRYAD